MYLKGQQAIWRNADHDIPVTIWGLAGEANGQNYWYVKNEHGEVTGIPEDQLETAEPQHQSLREYAHPQSLMVVRQDGREIEYLVGGTTRWAMIAPVQGPADSGAYGYFHKHDPDIMFGVWPQQGGGLQTLLECPECHDQLVIDWDYMF